VLKDESVKKVLLIILSHDIPISSRTRPLFDSIEDAVPLNSNEFHDMIKASLASPLATPFPALPSPFGTTVDVRQTDRFIIAPQARFALSQTRLQSASSSSSVLRTSLSLPLLPLSGRCHIKNGSIMTDLTNELHHHTSQTLCSSINVGRSSSRFSVVTVVEAFARKVP
jgi:hypothetical protein